MFLVERLSLAQQSNMQLKGVPISEVPPLYVVYSINTHTHSLNIWNQFSQYLNEIQEHLGVTVPEVDNTFNVPVNEFDGKITYGEKRSSGGRGKFQYHTQQLAPSRDHLMKMEYRAQSNFLRVQTTKSWFF